MLSIIDVAANVGGHAEKLAAAGVKTAIRYYNHKDVSIIGKCLTAPELKALQAAGLAVAVVFQQRGGADGHIGDFAAGKGKADAQRALHLAATLLQPQGSAIYFAVDHDYVAAGDLARIAAYFTEVAETVGGKYRIGAYGSGRLGSTLLDAGLIELFWLAGSKGWTDYQKMRGSNRWALSQDQLEQKAPFGGFGYDGNVAGPAFADFGQFTAAGVAPAAEKAGQTPALFAVVAKGGLRLRSGPGEQFEKIETLPLDTIVRGIGQEGDWIQVDKDGDGKADGYMSRLYLKPVAGGLPITEVAGKAPIDIAKAELALGIREFPGGADNPRIQLYHATTKGGAAPDETAWCSSFVNYCVEQAGLIGTDSKWAMDWQSWGIDATAKPAVGDIVVLKRLQGGKVEGGHVGFFLSDSGGIISLLGGNQGNAVSISAYPRNGAKGVYHYDLLSIRRPPG